LDPADTSPSPSIAPWDNSESYALIIESNIILVESKSSKSDERKEAKKKKRKKVEWMMEN
jgi:hypothetical protein